MRFLTGRPGMAGGRRTVPILVLAGLWASLTVGAPLACSPAYGACTGEVESRSNIPRLLAPSLDAPPNDQCSGAEIVPGDGPFPYLASLVPDLTEATNAGDPPLPSCQSDVSRSLWYQFTPAASGGYAFSTCADAPTGTTVADTVLAVYTSGGDGCDGSFTELLPSCGSAGCDDDSCAFEDGQSILRTELAAGTQYFIVVWKSGPDPPAAGEAAVQLQIIQSDPPANSKCEAAKAIFVDTPVTGENTAAGNDYELSGASCFQGTGQTPSAAAGQDVVYAFTAPSDGEYSFRATGYSGSSNLVLYVADACPQEASSRIVDTCLAAANRFPYSSAEEVPCLPLAAGRSVYVFVDEDVCDEGSVFTIEAGRCVREREPNDTPATAGERSCGAEGSIAPGGDADFYALGAPPFGWRVFAIVDGEAANSTDFDLRVITAADTLEYDDLNNDSQFGALSPNVAGTPVTGVPSYLRVSHFSASAQSEPYRLFAVVQPHAATATIEVEPNDVPAESNAAPNNYFTGSISSVEDVDLFSFTAASGDLIFLGLDGDPLRDGTPLNPSLSLLDSEGNELVSVNDSGSSSSNSPGTGSLTATTPNSPGESLVYRVPQSGTYVARVGLSFASSVTGDYLLSVATNCRVFPPADLSLTNDASSECVSSGEPLTYSLVTTNAGPATARNVRLTDTLPESVVFVSSSASQGSCEGTSTVTCSLGNIAPGAAATVGIGVTSLTDLPLANVASVTSEDADTHPENDSAVAASNGVCDDTNVCTTGDLCLAGVCVGGPPLACPPPDTCRMDGGCDPAAGCLYPPVLDGTPCDDGQVCTTLDSCVSGACSGGPGADCDDGKPCSDDSCAEGIGCVHSDNTAACDDGDACTRTDLCESGVCLGTNPQVCLPLDQCHDPGICDPGSGRCSDPPKHDGVPCSDRDACTAGDACASGACVSGSQRDCDDGVECTEDSCNPISGCLHRTTDLCCKTPRPKSVDFYRSVCSGARPDETVRVSDVDCVNNSLTFSGVSTAAAVCERLTPNPSSDKCEQAESQFLALLLNRCKYRLCDSQRVSISDLPTVRDVVLHVDALLSNPLRSTPACILAKREAKAANKRTSTNPVFGP